jgi:hypothetical protein
MSKNKKSGLIVDPMDLQGRLRFIGGSASDLWNNVLANQAIAGLWMAHSDEEQDRQRTATVVALAAIGPKDGKSTKRNQIAERISGRRGMLRRCRADEPGPTSIDENVFEIMPVRLSERGALNRRCAAMSCSGFCLVSI